MSTFFGSSMKIDLDTKQRVTGWLICGLELYKTTGCFLAVFLPHACGDRICSVSYNLTENHNLLHELTVVVNSFTFLSFVALYAVEMRRENWCIKYLDIDASKSLSYLTDEIEDYPELKRTMSQLNRRYRFLANFCAYSYAFNVIISMVEMTQSWPGASVLAPLISYLILVCTKLYKTQETATLSLRDERALSAYLTGQKTFNRIDADHRKSEVAADDQEMKEESEDVGPNVATETDALNDIDVSMEDKKNQTDSPIVPVEEEQKEKQE